MLYSIYFSPTGGTKKVADILSNSFDKNHENINILEKSCDPSLINFTKDDIAIFSLPCYGGVAPYPAIDKIKMMKGNAALAICVAVYGNRATDDQLLQMQDTLKECNFNVIAGIEALAEHSLARKVAEGRPNEKDNEVLTGFVKEIKKMIDTKSFNKELILPGNKPYKQFKGSGTKPILNKEVKCISCGTCAVQCPVDAINPDTPWETDYEKCISCMHCVKVCPTSARIVDPVKSKGTEEKLMSMAPLPKENKLFI